MRFKLDENLPADAARLLRDAGHDAMTILEQKMGGDPDSRVAEVCRAEQRTLITLDTDFADIRTYPPDAHSGILVLRLLRQDKPHVLSVLRRLLPLLQDAEIDGHLWIADEKRIRVR